MNKINSYTFLNFSYVKEDIKENKKLTEEFNEKYNLLNTVQLFLIEMFPSMSFNICEKEEIEGDKTRVLYSLSCDKLTMEDVVAINAYVQVYLLRTDNELCFETTKSNEAKCEQDVELLECEFSVNKIQNNKKASEKLDIIDDKITKIQQDIDTMWPNCKTSFNSEYFNVAKKSIGRYVFKVDCELADGVVAAQNLILKNFWENYSKELDYINVVPGLELALLDVVQDVDEFEKRFNV